MHLIASHAGRPSDDPIFALNQEATERRRAGESIVNATVGALLDDEGSLAVLPTATRAVREMEDWAAYAPIAGTPAFLLAVMDDLLQKDPLRATAVAVATPGGTGALRHAIANFLEPGQALLTTSYFWGPYQTLADEADRKVATFRMFGETGAFDVAAMKRALAEQLGSQGRVLLFLNDPCHNPTGYSMTPDEWRDVTEALVEASSRGPVTLLVDYAYAAYAKENDLLSRLAPLGGKVPVLFAWSASKTFTHYGLRVGALVACIPDPEERKQVEAALSYSCRGTWSNCSRGGQAAIAKLLTDPALRAATNQERDKLSSMLAERVSAFNRHAKERGLRYPRYDGGFFVTVFHERAKEKADAMRKAGVYVVPQKDALRVALCSVSVRDIPRLVEALST